MQRIQLQFFQFSVQIESEWAEVVELLKKDFWSYEVSSDSFKTAQLKITITQSQSAPAFPKAVASMQTQSAISYDQGDVRYCDYYDDLKSIINFKTNEAALFSMNLEKMHEIAYLLVLSRVGKSLDLKGLHKLHAFAVSFHDMALVCMMPSKGGKSTLLSHLLKDSRIKMISDDIPFIDRNGHVYPFLLKIGLDQIPPELEIQNPEQNIYSMKRSHHGTKQLVCTRGLSAKIENPDNVFSRIILFESFRFNSEKSVIVKASFSKTFKGLFKHGIIGVGSPIIIEYFWQAGIGDFFRKTNIFFRRLLAFTVLCLKSERYHLYSGKNPSITALEVIRFLERKQRNSTSI